MSTCARDEFIRNARILIVDDQEINVHLLETVLRQAGHTALECLTDPRQVLPRVTADSPDLILLDLMMPHLDGFMVMQQLAEAVPDGCRPPVLVLTADLSPEAKQRALRSGAGDFVLKPFDTTELLLRMRNLLENRCLQLKLQSQNDRLEARFRERTQELEAARERLVLAESENKRFCREVLRCVTQDKLHLVDPEEVPVEGREIGFFALDRSMGYAELRARLRDLSIAAGMDESDAADLVLATGEAAANAIKHGEGGSCSIAETRNRLIIRVTDSGPGIRAEDVPASLLLPGFSSKVSLGMGYTLMLKLADRIWLATGPAGTIVQLEKWIRPEDRTEAELVGLLERF
jgi:DNA-binding response OmpR family regulator/anti-sigma regulatory factor (Ser/Thr protein kinase)